MKYVIEAVPPSNNKFSGRKNVWEYRNEKKDWEQLVAAKCTPKPSKPFEHAVVKLTYYFKTRGRRDPDNYSGKFILDGLVKAGIIIDDSFGHIKLELSGSYDKYNPRTEIEIMETNHD
jgi:Holliday junction resolvase RusA-like endonuclease